jgi:iduronate 2-sulfatase
MIIAAPGMPRGTRTPALAELLDLYPTLVELCGLPAPGALDGISLIPALRDPGQSVRTAALTQHPRPAYYDREPSKTPTAMGYSLRTDRYRYIEWRDWNTGQTLARELYDHRADDPETRNLAADPARDADMRECAAALQQFRPIVRTGWQPTLP